jgi:YVTN family beta-propeller protein
MLARTIRARWAMHQWRVIPAVLMSLTAGLGSLVPAARAAADAVSSNGSFASLAGSASPVTAYVANSDSGTVTPIATATNTVGAPILAGSSPYAITITPDGKTAYVADVFSDTVISIATATNTAGPSITVGNGPYVIAVTPDGKAAYVANRFSGTVTPIATATNTAGAPITVGSDPIAIAVTPDGKTAYVANEGSGAVSTVIPIATATNTAGTPITVGTEPYAIAITPDGKTAYVANGGSGTVTPIATATNTADPSMTVGSDPTAIAITPGTVTQGPAFTSSASTTAAYGVLFSFTVTATGYPRPRITRTGRLPSGVTFTRNGDGTAAISGTPRKAAAGVYPLTLTARNKNGTAIQAFSLTVTRAPAIRKVRAIRVRVGTGLRLTIRATGYPAPALAEFGLLPGGLSFTDNGHGTAVIAGTAPADSGGRYPITITATSTSGIATRHFTIIVSQRRMR